jgi:tetratricopeptide (TPR) repeat protein
MTSAKVYLQQNETDNAITALEKEIANNPTNGEAYMLMAESLHSKQRYPEISDYFELALQNNPELIDKIGAKREEMWRPFFNRGLSMTTAGRTEQALKVYGIAKDIHPDKPDTYYALGFLHYKKGEVDLAIESWEAAIDKLHQAGMGEGGRPVSDIRREVSGGRRGSDTEHVHCLRPDGPAVTDGR